MSNYETLLETYEQARRDHGIVEAFKIVDAKAREIYQDPAGRAIEGLCRLHDRARTRTCIGIRIYADKGPKVIVDLLDAHDSEEASFDGPSIEEALCRVLDVVEEKERENHEKHAGAAPELADEMRAR